MTTTATSAHSRWKPRFTFPVYRQMDSMDCGPTCLRMVAKFHGRSYSLQHLRDRCHLGKQGVSLLGIAYAAESLGMRTVSAKTTWAALEREAPMPCIVHWNQNHFVVVQRVKGDRVWLADPAEGAITVTRDEFLRGWASITEGGEQLGVVLLLEPTPAFHGHEQANGERPMGMRFLLGYARPYRRFFVQVVLGMLAASLLQLVFPFLTQAIVDHGINNQDLNFVYVVLVAQLSLFFSRTAVEFLRNRILFHVGTRIYVTIISDFLIKLMKLPVSFFDTRSVGDILQRVQDHTRLQQFLTHTTLNVVFSAFTLVVFSIVLALYNATIFWVFAGGSAAYFVYVMLFLKRRRELEAQRFAQLASSQSRLVEMVTGMQEIKLGNAEQQKRWGWERIQAQLFKVEMRSLGLDQMQNGGAVFINELKNITVTFLAARLVIQGDLTLGMLLAVQYILGQLNAPLLQLVEFVHTAQYTRISLERLGEIHGARDEEQAEGQETDLPERRGIRLNKVSFDYGGPLPKPVLQDVDLEIPEGKVTAIVGTSGSGKTTLLKLLLKFYAPTGGDITVGGSSLKGLSSRTWRDACGAVMQDGHMFADSIAGNLAVGGEQVDRRRLAEAVRVANIQEFVEALPIGYNTQVGKDGVGMSQGQKQRLLIARAVYKNPEYLFFDEATSSLDANNERVIMGNLAEFFRGRTVVVIAHRLSTVKHADQIVVLDRGRVVERGTHAELTRLRGAYYELVKNQLELGN